jgi:hypothetical protein
VCGCVRARARAREPLYGQGTHNLTTRPNKPNRTEPNAQLINIMRWKRLTDWGSYRIYLRSKQ